jgi:hypothetical protein
MHIQNYLTISVEAAGIKVVVHNQMNIDEKKNHSWYGDSKIFGKRFDDLTIR